MLSTCSCPMVARGQTQRQGPPPVCGGSKSFPMQISMRPASALRLRLRVAGPARKQVCVATSSVSLETEKKTELDVLRDLEVISVASGKAVSAASIVPSSKRLLLPFFTQFGDFDSFEMAQRLVDYIPQLDAAGVELSAVGIGSLEAARLFAEKTNFPVDRLYCDPSAATYEALRFEPGCGRAGGPLDFMESLPAPLNSGMTKLLLMCAGVGSPGTLAEVFRGYLGDAGAPPVFNSGSNVDLAWKGAFDLVGKGTQRPFELATLRASNMATILSNWKTLAPEESDLLVQRGGTLVFDSGATVFRHDDAGILGFCKPARAVARALAPNPSAVDAAEARRLVAAAAASRSADKDELYEALRMFEKVPPRERAFSLRDLHGQWLLQYTTGTRPAGGLGFSRSGLPRRPGGGYFPLRAVQSFNADTGHIRNAVFLGPLLALYFDGNFTFDEKVKILEFQFDSVSLRLGGKGSEPKTWKIGPSAWDALKAESSLEGKRLPKAKRGRSGNPFFKWVFAENGAIAARGRGGGLALWARHAAEPVEGREATM